MDTFTQVIEAPVREFEPRKHRLFLAGGITNCPDWQQEVISDLKNLPSLTIFNPRRKEFPIDDPSASNEQIKWEFDFLKSATEIAVWFSQGSINPIVLYELGIWVNARPHIPAFVGIDPGYVRTQDVITQTELARPDIHPVFSLKAFSCQIKNYILGIS